MSDNKIHTLGRIDQAIRGINSDGTDDGYIPPQSENGALERIEKSIKAIDIKGIKSGLPKVTNADNGKVLKVISGKWGKGDKPSESIYANDFAEHFDEYALKDVVYFVDGTVEPYTRFNESIDSQEAAQNKVYAGPVNPSVVIIGYEPWHAFSDNAEHGFSTVYDESDGSYLQYAFEYPQHVRAISFKLKYETNLDEPPTIPVELYIELHDGHKGWKDRTLIFRGSIDEDFEFMWYSPTSNPLSITDSIRFINTSPLSDNSTYVVSIANIQLFDASSELYTGDKSIWYKGEKFSNVSEGGDSGGPTRTVLWETDLDDNPKIIRINGTADTKMLRLSDTIDNYDVIEVYAGNIDGDSQFYSTPMQAFDTGYILRPNPSNSSIGQPMKIESILAGHIDRFNYYVVLNDNDSGALNKKVIMANTADVAFYESMIIAKIIGVKY